MGMKVQNNYNVQYFVSHQFNIDKQQRAVRPLIYSDARSTEYTIFEMPKNEH